MEMRNSVRLLDTAAQVFNHVMLDRDPCDIEHILWIHAGLGTDQLTSVIGSTGMELDPEAVSGALLLSLGKTISQEKTLPMFRGTTASSQLSCAYKFYLTPRGRALYCVLSNLVPDLRIRKPVVAKAWMKVAEARKMPRLSRGAFVKRETELLMQFLAQWQWMELAEEEKPTAAELEGFKSAAAATEIPSLPEAPVQRATRPKAKAKAKAPAEPEVSTEAPTDVPDASEPPAAEPEIHAETIPPPDAADSRKGKRGKRKAKAAAPEETVSAEADAEVAPAAEPEMSAEATPVPKAAKKVKMAKAKAKAKVKAAAAVAVSAEAGAEVAPAAEPEMSAEATAVSAEASAEVAPAAEPEIAAEATAKPPKAKSKAKAKAKAAAPEPEAAPAPEPEPEGKAKAAAPAAEPPKKKPKLLTAYSAVMAARAAKQPAPELSPGSEEPEESEAGPVPCSPKHSEGTRIAELHRVPDFQRMPAPSAPYVNLHLDWLNEPDAAPATIVAPVSAPPAAVAPVSAPPAAAPPATIVAPVSAPPAAASPGRAYVPVVYATRASVGIRRKQDKRQIAVVRLLVCTLLLEAGPSQNPSEFEACSRHSTLRTFPELVKCSPQCH